MSHQDWKPVVFKKKEAQSGLKLKIKEMSKIFSLSQIKEGGFFIMIGKKK